MKVNEFVEGFINTEDKMEYVKEHITTDYIPYFTKVAECKEVINQTCYTTDEPKKFYMNTPNQHFFFILRLISLYTDIEISYGTENITTEYDKLSKNGCIDLIIASINEREYEEFRFMLSMCLDDIKDNELNIVNFINNKLDVLNLVSNTLVEGLIEISKNPEIQQVLSSLSQ